MRKKFGFYIGPCNDVVLFTKFFNSFLMFICMRFPSPNFLVQDFFP